MKDRELLRLNEVAELLGLSTQAVRMMVYRGSIPAYKLGGKIYVKRRELEEALKPVGKERGRGGEEENSLKEVSNGE